MHYVIEGTSQELASYLEQSPNRKFRLVELDEAAEAETTAPTLSEKSQAALALLDTWIAEGKAADEQMRREADHEVEEFKRNMNANRLATGERIVYP